MDMHAIMDIIDLIPLEDLFIINIDMDGLQHVGYTLGRLLFQWFKKKILTWLAHFGMIGSGLGLDISLLNILEDCIFLFINNVISTMFLIHNMCLLM